MKLTRLLRRAALLAFATLASSPFSSLAVAQELRVLVHNSFSLPKALLAQFEAQSGAKLTVIKAGDAAELLNKLILTRAQPIADVVFGIDNALVAKANAAQVLDALPADPNASAPVVGANVRAIDYGYVVLNYDKAAFAKSGLPLPQTLDDLAQPRYRDLLAVANPATSSTGHAFLMATIAGLGETTAFDWWARLRANGVKITKGWSEAYYTEFSRNGGTRPLVVSYAASPAAEVHYSKEKITEPPTGNLFLEGGVFRQVEGAALIKGGAQREIAVKFIDFLRSPGVQEALQTSMWMFPAEPGTPRPEVMRHATEPAAFDAPTAEQIGEKDADWVSRWTRIVLK